MYKFQKGQLVEVTDQHTSDRPKVGSQGVVLGRRTIFRDERGLDVNEYLVSFEMVHPIWNCEESSLKEATV